MSDRPDALVRDLESGRFEFALSPLQTIYYSFERALGHIALRASPPKLPAPVFLNLGCGPHILPGWVNADDYAPKRRLRETAFRPNWSLDITRPWKCPDETWDGVFTEHVLEHVSYSQAVHVLKECLRTMKPGAWLRISVPDLDKYIAFYNEGGAGGAVGNFPHPAVAISFLTQMHLHRSAWNGDLFVRVLAELGFTDARTVSYREGTDARLIRDDADKAHESLYVEARKPGP